LKKKRTPQNSRDEVLKAAKMKTVLKTAQIKTVLKAAEVKTVLKVVRRQSSQMHR
jgi:hypothetical protein